MSSLRFVTVGRFLHPIAAWMLRNRLVEEGVDAFVADEFTVSVYWIYAEAIGGVKVQVPFDQLSAAQEVMDRGDEGACSFSPQPPTEEDSLVCSTCGSANVSEELFSKRGAFLSWVLIGIPFPVLSTAIDCYECGARSGAPKCFRFKISGVLLLLFLVFLFVVTRLIFSALTN